MSGFAGKVALVTGAGGMKGIGRSVALELARHGADLVLAQSAALDLASAGITVNCVCPGPVNTGRLSRWERAQAEQAGIPLEAFRTRVVAEAAGATPLGRIAEPEEVATAREGLTAARRARPTVLVCDIAMPGGDGFSMIQAQVGRDRRRAEPGARAHRLRAARGPGAGARRRLRPAPGEARRARRPRPGGGPPGRPRAAGLTGPSQGRHGPSLRIERPMRNGSSGTGWLAQRKLAEWRKPQ